MGREGAKGRPARSLLGDDWILFVKRQMAKTSFTRKKGGTDYFPNYSKLILYYNLSV
jgi:hypothetical protein